MIDHLFGLMVTLARTSLKNPGTSCPGDALEENKN
jgi:hypothetical protein